MTQRFDRALDLAVAHARVPEQRAVVDERPDQIEKQVAIDVLAQVTAGVRPVERFLTAARGGSNSVVMNASRRSRSPAQSADNGPITSGGMRRNTATNSFRHFVEIAQRATGVRRQRLAEALAERGEHQPLAVGQRR